MSTFLFKNEPIQHWLSSSLGPTYSRRIALLEKPFPTSTHWTLSNVLATTTKICTRGWFQVRSRAVLFATTSTSGYQWGHHQKNRKPHWECESAARFTAIHFKGGRIWPVSCYTLLRRCRLPWPRSGCLDPPTPFRYWAGNSAPLSPRSVEPVLPALLTNADPLCFAMYFMHQKFVKKERKKKFFPFFLSPSSFNVHALQIKKVEF